MTWARSEVARSEGLEPPDPDRRERILLKARKLADKTDIRKFRRKGP